jgi:hypothetical protein
MNNSNNQIIQTLRLRIRIKIETSDGSESKISGGILSVRFFWISTVLPFPRDTRLDFEVEGRLEERLLILKLTFKVGECNTLGGLTIAPSCKFSVCVLTSLFSTLLLYTLKEVFQLSKGFGLSKIGSNGVTSSSDKDFLLKDFMRLCFKIEAGL